MSYHNPNDPVEESIDTPETVLESIRTGQYDNHLDSMLDALFYRRKSVNLSRVASMKIGDTVEIVNGRPHYLHGVRAKVTDVMQTWCKIQLFQTIGKFNAGVNIRCPMTMLKIVTPT